jgi:hypothetical protein
MSASGRVVVLLAGSPRRALATRAAALLVVAGLLAAALVTFVARPAPAGAAACGTQHRAGVTVVVDFRHFHKGIKVGCDATRPATGLVALTKAGFRYTFVPRFPGFICTISKEPGKCNGAPANAYWSYWHAKPHGKWIYSKLGAASYHPKSGWVEGWAFGDGKPPGISPP